MRLGADRRRSANGAQERDNRLIILGLFAFAFALAAGGAGQVGDRLRYEERRSEWVRSAT